MISGNFRLMAAWTGCGLALVLALAVTSRAADPPKGLVLHFSFDKQEPEGKVSDRSGLNNHGKLSDAKWVPTGKQGGGCELDASTDHILVPAADSLKVKQATFAAWFLVIRPDAVWRRMLEDRDGKSFALGIAGDSKDSQTRGRLAAAINGTNLCLSDNVVADGAWHHAAATFDGENIRLYVDAVPQKQVVPLKEELAAIGQGLTVGMGRKEPPPPGSGESLMGTVDEVMVFNRALSADEIKAMVLAVDPNAGKPKFTKSQVAGRLRQLKALFEEGLLTEDFYARKVAECEAAQ